MPLLPFDQAEGIAGLDVLREDEDARLGKARADLRGRDEPLVGVGGRHADVDDGTSGGASSTTESSAPSSCLAADIESLVLQQACQPVADERRVVGDHDAHGISATIRVPPPCGLSIVSSPSSAPTRSARPRSPDPAVGPGAAPSVVADLDAGAAVLATDGDPGLVAAAYFAMFASDSATTK